MAVLGLNFFTLQHLDHGLIGRCERIMLRAGSIENTVFILQAAPMR